MKDYALSEDYQLLSKILLSNLSFLNYMTPLADVKDEIPLTELFITEVLQPGNKDTFTPKGGANFKARIGKVRPGKVDLRFTPTQITTLYKSYLGQVSGGKIDIYQFPFEAFIMTKIIERLRRDIHLRAVFTGVYNAAGTAAADIMDGLLTKVAADITAGNIPASNVLAGAPITAVNAYDQVSALVDRVVADPEYNSVPMVMLLSPLNMRRYNQDYQTTFGALPYNNGFEQQIIDGTSIRFVVEPGLTGSNRLIVTPQENFYWLVDDQSRIDTLTVEYALRNISVMVDFNAGVEYGIAELIWTNDQA